MKRIDRCVHALPLFLIASLTGFTSLSATGPAAGGEQTASGTVVERPYQQGAEDAEVQS